MAGQTIKKRVRFFVAVEGESEQSFLVWLQVLAQKELHIHLDDVLLGGDVINWAQSILAGCGTDEEFFAQTARSERGARGLVFKLVRDGGAGTWHNVRRQHTVADFARSMLEGLAGQVAVMVRQLGGAASHRPVFAGGGGSRCPLFVQIVSEALGVPITTVSASPLLGAAMLAMASSFPAKKSAKHLVPSNGS